MVREKSIYFHYFNNFFQACEMSPFIELENALCSMPLACHLYLFMPSNYRLILFRVLSLGDS